MSGVFLFYYVIITEITEYSMQEVLTQRTDHQKAFNHLLSLTKALRIPEKIAETLNARSKEIYIFLNNEVEQISIEINEEEYIIGFNKETNVAYFKCYHLRGGTTTFDREYKNPSSPTLVYRREKSIFFYIMMAPFLIGMIAGLWTSSLGATLVLEIFLIYSLLFLFKPYFHQISLQRKGHILDITSSIFYIKKRSQVSIQNIISLSLLSKSGKPLLSRVTIPMHYFIVIKTNKKLIKLPSEYYSIQSAALEQRTLMQWLALDKKNGSS